MNAELGQDAKTSLEALIEDQDLSTITRTVAAGINGDRPALLWMPSAELDSNEIVIARGIAPWRSVQPAEGSLARKQYLVDLKDLGREPPPAWGFVTGTLRRGHGELNWQFNPDGAQYEHTIHASAEAAWDAMLIAALKCPTKQRRR